MQIQDIRRARLAQLIRENYESQADFVTKTGENQGEISALLKTKSFGEKKARKIESECGLPTGWLDAPASIENTTVIALHPDDPLPDDMVSVPESRIEFSAGNGRTASYELVEDEEPATYRRSWFQKHGMNPTKVRRFRVSGDSMEPAIYARDTILVNTEETNIIDGKTYAIRYGDELRVKKLYRRIDGTIILRSVNPEYKDEEIPAELAEEHISVIGRVRESSGTGGF